jgi:hypothetical protein
MIGATDGRYSDSLLIRRTFNTTTLQRMEGS